MKSLILVLAVSATCFADDQIAKQQELERAQRIAAAQKANEQRAADAQKQTKKDQRYQQSQQEKYNQKMNNLKDANPLKYK